MIQDHSQPFCTTIPVRITDLNYGQHVGNDALVSLIHEARVQFLNSIGFAENQFGEHSLILSRLEVNYKGQVFYPEALTAYVTVREIKACTFNLNYHFKNNLDKDVLQAVTEMVCFNYDVNKIRRLPKEFLNLFQKGQR